MAVDQGSRLVQVGRRATPAIIALILLLLSLMPFGLPGVGRVMPPLALMAVFYWSIYRPDLFPLLAAFGLGLLQDLLSGGPPGLFAAIYVAVQAVMASQRRSFIGRAFAIEWFGFGVVVIAATLAAWAVSSGYYARVLRPEAFLTQAFLAVAIYPALNWTMSRLRRAVSHI
jgi:rod shape-determining protein MreD